MPQPVFGQTAINEIRPVSEEMAKNRHTKALLELN